MNVVIVESAAKAKTINKYLGSGYKVIASFGHVRDLPAKNGSVEPDKDFEMHWDVDPKSQKIMKEIADAVKKADKLILATDPDREGEAISWHILQILEQKKALKKDTLVERVAFNAVTKQAILTALSEPRQIDGPARFRLPRAPGARLSRRLHPVAGAVAQAAGRPLGGTRAVRRPAPRLRPRGRDRGLPHRRVLDHRRRDGDRQGRGVCRPPQRHRRHERSRSSTSRRATTPTPSRPPSRRASSASSRSTRRASSATRTRRSPPRRCRWTPRASSASRPSRRCRSPSASMRASTSAARPSASSPTCEPTASPSCRRRSAPSAG